MSRTADVDGARITVPEGWWVWKYDDSAFHRRQFQGFAGGSKAVDAIALATDGTLWLIELKDYRRQRRTKPSSVFAETASKVRATLAGLAVARLRANDTGERELARQAMRCRNIRVVLQLAQPARPSRLFPQVVDPQSAMTKLRAEVKAVDPHPLCVTDAHDNRRRLPWTTDAIARAAA